LALAGIPPLSGFWSKDEILLAVQRDGGPIFLVLFLAAAVLSALYMARAVRIVFFGPLKPETEHAHEGPLSMRIPLVVFGLVTVAVGFIALPLLGSDGLGNFLFSKEAHDFKFDALWSPVGIVLALGGFFAAWRLFSGPPERVERLRERFAPVHRLLINKYYLDDIYQWVVDNVALRAARIVAVFDRVVVNDGGVNGTGETVINAGRRLRALATGKLYNYGMAMGLGVVFIAVLLWASA
jgi:NADH-quinone oxidoreductase subunit L